MDALIKRWQKGRTPPRTPFLPYFYGSPVYAGKNTYPAKNGRTIFIKYYVEKKRIWLRVGLSH
jgi:hypothetical protein